MKTFKLLTLAYALCTIFQVQAQDQVDPTKSLSPTKKWGHELGMNVYSSTVREGNSYNSYRTIYDHYPVSGLYYKLFHGKSAIRTSVDYFQKIIISSHNKYDRIISFKTLQFAAGYQRHFGSRKIMPYVFTDLSCGFGKELVNGYYYGPLATYTEQFLYYPGYVPLPATIKTTVFSVSPGIGLRLKLGKNMILAFETAAEFFYVIQREDYRRNALRNAGINAKPLKCSFGFTF